MRSLFALVVSVSLFFGGCLSSHTQIMADTDPRGWGRDDEVSLVFNNQDTVGLYDLDVLMRYDERFVDKSIDLQITTIAPGSSLFSEQICFTVDRRQAIKTSVDFQEIQLSYRQKVKLSQFGEYRFKITSIYDIKGVWAMGINFIR